MPYLDMQGLLDPTAPEGWRWYNIGHPGANRPAVGVDVDAFQQRQVDQQSVVAGALAGDAVTAAANRDGEAGVSGEPDRRCHIGCIDWAYDDRRPLVDHGVPDLASLVVAGVGRREEVALDRALQPSGPAS